MTLEPFAHFREINSCKYLFLREIAEPNDNELRLIIEEASPGPAKLVELPGGINLGNARLIESTVGDRLFELTWNTYIAYSVRNESYVQLDKSEVIESGRLICIYSKSHFLDYVAKATFASAEYPGNFTHVEIKCENHIIDVASTSDPDIRQLRSFQSSVH